jgi:hypothetical protein
MAVARSESLEGIMATPTEARAYAMGVLEAAQICETYEKRVINVEIDKEVYVRVNSQGQL